MEEHKDALKPEIYAGLRRAFQADKAKEIEVSILFDLTGDDGFGFYALISNQSLDFSEEVQSARVKMKMPLHDFIGLLRGTISANEAFLTGKLKVGGNLLYAMKLAPVFKFGQGSPEGTRR